MTITTAQQSNPQERAVRLTVLRNGVVLGMAIVAALPALVLEGIDVTRGDASWFTLLLITLSSFLGGWGNRRWGLSV